MINLSQTNFGPSEIHVLEKGLNFIPTPKVITKTPILEAATKFSRRLKLAYRFRNSKNVRTQKFVKKSEWTPNETEMPKEVLETIQKINNDLSELNIPKPKKNLSYPEFKALNAIRNNSAIIIKPADKGSATVIMDKQNYINEGHRQLSDDRYYKKIHSPIFRDTATKISEILTDLKNRHFISQKQLEYLQPPNDPRPRHMYLLPKIHKPIEKWPTPHQPPGRPIISDCSSESYAVSEYIDHFLAPLACKHDSYLKDTPDFLNKLKQARVTPDTLIITMDVEQMYPNIDHDAGLAAVKKAFDNNPDPTRPDEEILKLLEISLKNNDFDFNGETFLQTKGTAMGKRFAPSYANIFMANWETEAFKKCYQLPTLYFRFLDDIYIHWDHGRENFETFFRIMNNHDPSIKLTVRSEETENDYLDTTVFKGPLTAETGILDTKVFFKPTDTHQLLHKESYHPKHTFRGILKSQILRFYRNCSQKVDFDKACAFVFHKLRQRGYSERSLRYIKSETLQKLNSGESFTPPGIDIEPDTEYHGQPCKHQFCFICDDVRESSSVISNTTKFVFKLHHNMDCNSSNLIYLVNCKECKKQYIGKTKNSLRRRAHGHRNDIIHKRFAQCETATHFNTGACTLEDFQITPIFQCPKFDDLTLRAKVLHQTEQHFIRAFKSYLPYGINISLDKFTDSRTIHLSIPFSEGSRLAANIIREHFIELQKLLPHAFPHFMVTAYSRNKNIKDMLVSSKIRNNQNTNGHS